MSTKELESKREREREERWNKGNSRSVTSERGRKEVKRFEVPKGQREKEVGVLV